MKDNLYVIVFCSIFFLLRTTVIQTMNNIFGRQSNLKKYVKSILNEKDYDITKLCTRNIIRC